MLNLIQHLTRSRAYETLKQVQGDKSGAFYGTIKVKFKTEAENIIIDSKE